MSERLLEAVKSLGIAHTGGCHGGHVTVSIGATSAVPRDMRARRGLYKSADKALYEAKKTGRSKACFGPFEEIQSAS